MDQITRILSAVIAEAEAGRRVALCAIVATRGSTPQPAGALLCVDEAVAVTGTLGGGCVEADVRRRAYELLTTGRGELAVFKLDHDYGYDDGMICGGEMDIAVDVITSPERAQQLRQAQEQLASGGAASITLRIETADGPTEYRLNLEAQPRLVIAGGGHIARILAGLAVQMGFRVSVIDDRAQFANAKRFPPPVEPVTGPIAETLRDWPIDANTYVVLVTRGHRHDEKALAAILDRPARYVGMIGSRRKIDIIFDDLLAGGASREHLDRVHAPVGLDINALTTDEIALSIAAQLVAVRRADGRKAVEGPFPIAKPAS